MLVRQPTVSTVGFGLSRSEAERLTLTQIGNLFRSADKHGMPINIERSRRQFEADVEDRKQARKDMEASLAMLD